MNIVITQPMYFPWLGLIEQIALADIVVIYDDVEYSKGSFTNRVQLKSAKGQTWLTMPIQNYANNKKINEYLTSANNWREDHLRLFQTLYKEAPYFDDAYCLLETALKSDINTISEISSLSIQVLLEYLNIRKEFLYSSYMEASSKSSQRVFDIVKTLGGTNYITGHGAKNYLDYTLFEEHNIEVSFIDYACKPYPQLHGDFTPYVSMLDVIANLGKEAHTIMQSKLVNYKKFITAQK